MLTLSITGLFKTLLILIGAFVVLRFFGQLMIAKRNLAEEKEMKEREKRFEREKRDKERTLGKTQVLRGGNPKEDVQDVDFEEMR